MILTQVLFTFYLLKIKNEIKFHFQIFVYGSSMREYLIAIAVVDVEKLCNDIRKTDKNVINSYENLK